MFLLASLVLVVVVVAAAAAAADAGEKVWLVGERVADAVAKKGVVGEVCVDVVVKEVGDVGAEFVVSLATEKVPEETIWWFEGQMKIGRPIVSLASVSIFFAFFRLACVSGSKGLSDS